MTTSSPTSTAHENSRPLLWTSRLAFGGCIASLFAFLFLGVGAVLNGKEVHFYVYVGLLVFAALSLLTGIVAGVDLCRKGDDKMKQAYAVWTTIILTLPMSILCLWNILAAISVSPQNPVHIAQEQEQQKELVQTHVAQQLPASTPLPLIDYTDNGIVIPNFYRSSQHRHPIIGLSFKPTADFGDTFAGHRQFVMTVTNQYSGQAIAIEAIYTDKCANRWKAYPNSDAPDHLAHLGTGLLTGELLFGEYQCVGLQLSTPLHISDTYISVEPNKTGSPVELAELPQLVNVIQNARPMQPAAAP